MVLYSKAMNLSIAKKQIKNNWDYFNFSTAQRLFLTTVLKMINFMLYFCC